MLRDYQRRVVESLSIAILVLDRRLRLLLMNSAAEALFESSFRKARKVALSDRSSAATRSSPDCGIVWKAGSRTSSASCN